jgi:glycine cleavage system H protein
MNCPFLQEARVKYCEKSAFRKMIRVAGHLPEETCATPRYKQCAVYQRFAEDSQDAQCPYLRESLAQYCATAASPQFIPYSEPLGSRCGNDSHRYCDVYLGTAGPERNKCRRVVAGMSMPEWLHYSANHMWLDAAHGGSCHLGLDAFLTRVLGTVEHITFLKQTGVHRPSVVLTVHGVDLEVIFPNPVLLTASNLYLRADPGKLTADPYGIGWLFEGVHLPGQPALTSGLIYGDALVPWIEGEIGRMSAFLAQCWNSRHGARLMNDGGVFCADVLPQLSREEALRLFHEFFWGLRYV